MINIICGIALAYLFKWFVDYQDKRELPKRLGAFTADIPAATLEAAKALNSDTGKSVMQLASTAVTKAAESAVAASSPSEPTASAPTIVGYTKSSGEPGTYVRYSDGTVQKV